MPKLKLKDDRAGLIVHVSDQEAGLKRGAHKLENTISSAVGGNQDDQLLDDFDSRKRHFQFNVVQLNENSDSLTVLKKKQQHKDMHQEDNSQQQNELAE